MRTAIIAVLLAILLVFAGCASPQDDEEGGDPADAESPTAGDNDAGAEPVNPPNETNGTQGNGTESGATVNPADENETGANESDLDETVTAESGANESGANETGTNATDDGDGGSYEFTNVARPLFASPV